MLPKSVIDLLFGWSNWIGKHSLDTWNLVPFCVMQTLWKKGNCRTFDNSESLVTQLKYCVRFLFDWSCAWGFTNSNSIVDFKESLYFCV